MQDSGNDSIFSYLPKAVLGNLRPILEEERLVIKLKGERKTRHGDYRRLPNGTHQISINTNLNPYGFLITLIHELAHLKVCITEYEHRAGWACERGSQGPNLGGNGQFLRETWQCGEGTPFCGSL